MNITSKQMKDFFTFITKHKRYVGLSDWSVLIANETKTMDGSFAEVEVNIYEQEMKIVLSNEFFNKTKKEQENILLHELVHGRLLIKDKKIDLYADIEDEFFVNDLVRGLESIKND